MKIQDAKCKHVWTFKILWTALQHCNRECLGAWPKHSVLWWKIEKWWKVERCDESTHQGFQRRKDQRPDTMQYIYVYYVRLTFCITLCGLVLSSTNLPPSQWVDLSSWSESAHLSQDSELCLQVVVDSLEAKENNRKINIKYLNN